MCAFFIDTEFSNRLKTGLSRELLVNIPADRGKIVTNALSNYCIIFFSRHT